jgi:addiction module RelE/StbE family toxin
MNAKLSPLVQKEILNISKKNPKLLAKIQKQIALFEENPKHPSLRAHKLSGNLDNMWSISIDMSIRMVYLKIDEKSVVFVRVGKHDEVY